MTHEIGIEGQPTLVVGGGYGIGRATTLLLAEYGARIAVADIVPERAEANAKEVDGHAIVADVTTEGEATRVVDEAREALGGLTRVANIVGRATFALFDDAD